MAKMRTPSSIAGMRTTADGSESSSACHTRSSNACSSAATFDGGANHVPGVWRPRCQARREVAQALAHLRDRVAVPDQLTKPVQRHPPGDEHQPRLAHRGQVRVAGRLGQAWRVAPLDRHGALPYQADQQPSLQQIGTRQPVLCPQEADGTT
jgi:hypothetical protein